MIFFIILIMVCSLLCQEKKMAKANLLCYCGKLWNIFQVPAGCQRVPTGLNGGNLLC